MALKDDLLPLLDELRGIPGELGFRPYQVEVRKVSWSGSRPGQGTRTITSTPLLVGNGQDPKVRSVTRKDVVAGTIEAVEGQWDIGPLTPAFAGGGVDADTLNPRKIPGQWVEVYFVITGGDDMPADGLLCKRVSDQVDHALRRVVRVTSIGVDAADATSP